MNTDFTDLSLMQISDSFFPTGLYTMSNGIETLFSEKRITGMDDICELIQTNIIQQIGPADCVALANAYDFATSKDVERIIACDKLLFSMKLVKELREATCRSGTQMIKCISSFVNNDILSKYYEAIKNYEASGTHAVVIGVVSNTLGIEKQKAVLQFLYGFSVSMVGAALRLGMIEHVQSQKILHQLRPIIVETCNKYISKPLGDMWQFAPECDVIQISHEQSFSKMFIT
jgi:urease accessory protein